MKSSCEGLGIPSRFYPLL